MWWYESKTKNHGNVLHLGFSGYFVEEIFYLFLQNHSGKTDTEYQPRTVQRYFLVWVRVVKSAVEIFYLLK